MTEKVTQEEQKVPTKEEIMLFLQEQIDVKKKQVELQELNTRLATSRAEELKALSFIGNITNPQPPADAVPHIVTQEDIDANPELIEAGVKVGDEVMIAKETEKEEKSKSRNLKK